MSDVFLFLGFASLWFLYILHFHIERKRKRKKENTPNVIQL
jgi:hypothetical protein